MMEQLPPAIVDFVEAKWGTPAGWIAAVVVIVLAIAAPFVVLKLL